MNTVGIIGCCDNDIGTFDDDAVVGGVVVDNGGGIRRVVVVVVVVVVGLQMTLVFFKKIYIIIFDL